MPLSTAIKSHSLYSTFSFACYVRLPKCTVSSGCSVFQRAKLESDLPNRGIILTLGRYPFGRSARLLRSSQRFSAVWSKGSSSPASKCSNTHFVFLRLLYRIDQMKIWNELRNMLAQALKYISHIRSMTDMFMHYESYNTPCNIFAFVKPQLTLK